MACGWQCLLFISIKVVANLIYGWNYLSNDLKCNELLKQTLANPGSSISPTEFTLHVRAREILASLLFLFTTDFFRES
jgi:hypothetical protein